MTRVSEHRATPLPHPRWRLPWLGDVLTVNPVRPTQASMADARRYGPIFERRIAGYPIVVVSGPDLIAEINDERHWTKNVGVLFKLMRPIVRDGLFTAYNHEPNWSRAHHILASAFTQEAMRGYHRTMAGAVSDLLEHWTARAGEWIDIADSANRFTLEVIGRAGFSYSFDSFTRGDEHPFVAAMGRGLRHINRNANLPPALHNLPRARAAQHRRDIAFAHGLVDEVIARRRREDPDGTADLLGLMLNSADPVTGERLDEINIRHQILTFLVAGHETSAGALAFALHFLAANPGIAARARAEVDERGSGGELEYADVGKLRYLRRVVDETLRLWPIAPGYFREARHDVTIGDGKYSFAEGDWVFVLTLQAHRDPVWGSDHDEFDPDRFLPENLRRLGPHIYKPFGTGERACIGRQFAYHEILLALAHILRTFTFEPDPRYRLKVREQITLKPDGFRLRLHPR
ncbi:cytochrome P450 [Nocardia puris]|uniref:Unspecific monooxygenase n=1 Tax=Nocardia puris TaxID=208602 RepID=A0A366DN51_9NOCA|nr:cytochrome P450 [Nocardia puris]RBO91502.1 unspecific monooxygenase [Nocardia puris]